MRETTASTSLRYGDRELEALVSLSNSNYFLTLIEYWAKRCQVLAINATRQADEVQTRWTAGRSQELGDIIREFENARETLEKMKRNPSGGGGM